MNRATFEKLLAEAYRDLFANDAAYAFAKARTTPEDLAKKMTAGMLDGSASKDGDGIRRVCKALRIKSTYKAIRAYCEAM